MEYFGEFSHNQFQQKSSTFLFCPSSRKLRVIPSLLSSHLPFEEGQAEIVSGPRSLSENNDSMEDFESGSQRFLLNTLTIASNCLLKNNNTDTSQDLTLQLVLQMNFEPEISKDNRIQGWAKDQDRKDVPGFITALKSTQSC